MVLRTVHVFGFLNPPTLLERTRTQKKTTPPPPLHSPQSTTDCSTAHAKQNTQVRRPSWRIFMCVLNRMQCAHALLAHIPTRLYARRFMNVSEPTGDRVDVNDDERKRTIRRSPPFDMEAIRSMRPFPSWLRSEMRSNHAGETGAVNIYLGCKSALALRKRFLPSSLRKVEYENAMLDFASEHEESERTHLILLNQIMDDRRFLVGDRSFLVCRRRSFFVWRINSPEDTSNRSFVLREFFAANGKKITSRALRHTSSMYIVRIHTKVSHASDRLAVRPKFSAKEDVC